MPKLATPRAMNPGRLRTFRAGTDRLEHPVDVLGRARFRAALSPGSVRVQRSADITAPIPFIGTSIVFNTRTWIPSTSGGFWEQIAPQAVTKTLLEADIRHLQNHNPDLLLARTNPQMRAAGTATLRLTPSPTGLITDADMAPTSYAQDLAILLERGDISQMSFAFDPLEWTREELPDGTTLITITLLRLYDTSVVTYPAYEETDAGLRAAAFDSVCRSNGFDPEAVVRGFATGGQMPDLREIPAAPSSRSLKRARLAGALSRSLNGWTLSDLWPLLDDAIVEATSTPEFNSYWYVYICAVSDEWFVYWDSRPGAAEAALWQVPYTVDVDGNVTLGTAVEVIEKTTYIAVPAEGPEDEPAIGDPPDDGQEMSRAPATATRTDSSAPVTATRTEGNEPNPGDRLREIRSLELADTLSEDS